MEHNGTNGTKGGGNTSSPPSSTAFKKSRKFCFTLNNWTDLEYGTINQTLLPMCKHWIIGKEIGEQKTPHLQGYLEFKNPRSFNTIKKICGRIHIERAKGSLKDNYIYCSKEGDFATNIDMRTPQEIMKEEILEDEYPNITWKPWQKEIIELLEKRPDRRKIYWYWDRTGNIGKSYLCKYLALTKDVIICEGKKADIFNQVKTCIDEKRTPKIILCDVPRTAQEYLNYGAIEQLKNGMMYSGKYEGGQCIFKIPHVIAFANAPPDESKMSMDRWNIVNLSPPHGGGG